MSAYLNHAGTSWPKPGPVRAAVSRVLEAEPSTWSENFASAQQRLERFLGLESGQRLLLTPGCTSALGLAIQDHPWRPGEGVALSAFEHVAVERPCAGLLRQGVEVHVLPPSPTALVDLDAAERIFRAGRIRLLAISAAANTSGDPLPVAQLAEIARRNGALVLVDAAQVVGWTSLGPLLANADLLAFGGHKGLQGVWGIGGLVIREGVPLSTPRMQEDLQGPGWCDGGSVDRAALAGLAAATEWLDAPAQADRLARARALCARLQDGLPSLGADGWTPLARHPIEARMPIVALAGSERRLSRAKARLTSAGIVAGFGLQCAPLAHRHWGTNPTGTLRLSVGPTSTEADIDAAVRALDGVS